MTPKQKEDFNLMLSTLREIANNYMKIEELKEQSETTFGLDYESALEMAYENMQSEAIFAIKGIKFIN